MLITTNKFLMASNLTRNQIKFWKKDHILIMQFIFTLTNRKYWS